MTPQQTPTRAPRDALLELIGRLEKATEGLVLLDLDIALALGEWSPPRGYERQRPDYPTCWSKKGRNVYQPNTPYSRSIDAALALIELKLPGWYVKIMVYENGGGAAHASIGRYVNHELEFRDSLNTTDTGARRTVPLALCIALLKALHATSVQAEEGKAV